MKISCVNSMVILYGGKTNEAKAYYLRICIRRQCGKGQAEEQVNNGKFERILIGYDELSTLLGKK